MTVTYLHLTPSRELTYRQEEVLRLLAEGLSNREIGVRLWITVNAVKEHVLLLRGKLQARSRAHAVALGYQRGILQ